MFMRLSTHEFLYTRAVNIPTGVLFNYLQTRSTVNIKDAFDPVLFAVIYCLCYTDFSLLIMVSKFVLLI